MRIGQLVKVIKPLSFFKDPFLGRIIRITDAGKYTVAPETIEDYLESDLQAIETDENGTPTANAVIKELNALLKE
jgi:hypothetical protein